MLQQNYRQSLSFAAQLLGVLFAARVRCVLRAVSCALCAAKVVELSDAVRTGTIRDHPQRESPRYGPVLRGEGYR